MPEKILKKYAELWAARLLNAEAADLPEHQLNMVRFACQIVGNDIDTLISQAAVSAPAPEALPSIGDLRSSS